MSRNCLEGYCGELTFPWAAPASPHTQAPEPPSPPASQPTLQLCSRRLPCVLTQWWQRELGGWWETESHLLASDSRSTGIRGEGE